MGSSKYTLKRSMIRGDEMQVLQVYRSRTDIRRHIEPNQVLNEDGDTFVHYASRFAMKTVLRYSRVLFLSYKEIGLALCAYILCYIIMQKEKTYAEVITGKKQDMYLYIHV
jgi:hypothetical protein